MPFLPPNQQRQSTEGTQLKLLTLQKVQQQTFITRLMSSTICLRSPSKRAAAGPLRTRDASTRSDFSDDRQRAKTASPA